MASASTLLTVNDLTVRFGGIVALNKVNFTVADGSITALIGPNGAGKTTAFNCITGFYRPTHGAINLAKSGKDVSLTDLNAGFRGTELFNPTKFGKAIWQLFFGGTHQIARAGVGRTFQNIRLFPEMTVIENLLVAQHMRCNRNLLSGLLRMPGFKAREEQVINSAYEWLDEVNLGGEAQRLAGELSYGNQRRLEIARAMCTQPTIICLDEPAAGLNPQETEDLGALIRRLREKYQVTVFVIEHDMKLVMDISEHIIVLNHGEVIADGEPEAVRNDPKVLNAYLGTGS